MLSALLLIRPTLRVSSVPHLIACRSFLLSATLVGRIGGDSVYRQRWQPIEHISLITIYIVLFLGLHKFLASFWYVCLLRLAISTHVGLLCKGCSQFIFPFNSQLTFQRLSSFMGMIIMSHVLWPLFRTVCRAHLWAVQKLLNRHGKLDWDAVWGGRLLGPTKTLDRGCTLVLSAGKYDWTIRTQRRCGLMSNRCLIKHGV